jgi:hypothetical protein
MPELSFCLSDLFNYPSPRQVVFPELNRNPVARQQPDPIPFRHPGPVSQNLRFVTQLQLENQAGQFFQNHSFDRHLL